MHWDTLKVVIAAIAALFPFFFSVSRNLIFKAFRHPNTPTQIVRDDSGKLRVEN